MPNAIGVDPPDFKPHDQIPAKQAARGGAVQAGARLAGWQSAPVERAKAHSGQALRCWAVMESGKIILQFDAPPEQTPRPCTPKLLFYATNPCYGASPMTARLSRLMLRNLILLSTGAALWTSPAFPAVKPIAAQDPRTAWLGKWIGPEGTFLQLSRQGKAYRITIRPLDGQRRFTGKAVGQDRIQFQRDGKTLQIRAGNGQSTG
ncbi:MAG: hypothetical protein EHM62_07865, partial [Methylococcus sp.]